METGKSAEEAGPSLLAGGPDAKLRIVAGPLS